MFFKGLVGKLVVKIYNEKHWPFIKKETMKMTPLRTDKKEKKEKSGKKTNTKSNSRLNRKQL